MTTFLIIYRFSLPLVCLTALASMFFFSYFIFIGTHRFSLFFFFNDPAPPEIYTLPLHDALPISRRARAAAGGCAGHAGVQQVRSRGRPAGPRHAHPPAARHAVRAHRPGAGGAARASEAEIGRAHV